MTSVHNCEGSRMLKNKHTRSDGNTLNTACYAKVSLSVLPNNNIVSPVCQPASHKWDLSLPLSLLLAPLCRNFVLWCTALILCDITKGTDSSPTLMATSSLSGETAAVCHFPTLKLYFHWLVIERITLLPSFESGPALCKTIYELTLLTLLLIN